MAKELVIGQQIREPRFGVESAGCPGVHLRSHARLLAVTRRLLCFGAWRLRCGLRALSVAAAAARAAAANKPANRRLGTELLPAWVTLRRPVPAAQLHSLYMLQLRR